MPTGEPRQPQRWVPAIMRVSTRCVACGVQVSVAFPSPGDDMYLKTEHSVLIAVRCWNDQPRTHSGAGQQPLADRAARFVEASC